MDVVPPSEGSTMSCVSVLCWLFLGEAFSDVKSLTWSSLDRLPDPPWWWVAITPFDSFSNAVDVTKTGWDVVDGLGTGKSVLADDARSSKGASVVKAFVELGWAPFLPDTLDGLSSSTPFFGTTPLALSGDVCFMSRSFLPLLPLCSSFTPFFGTDGTPFSMSTPFFGTEVTVSGSWTTGGTCIVPLAAGAKGTVLDWSSNVCMWISGFRVWNNKVTTGFVSDASDLPS